MTTVRSARTLLVLSACGEDQPRLIILLVYPILYGIMDNAGKFKMHRQCLASLCLSLSVLPSFTMAMECSQISNPIDRETCELECRMGECKDAPVPAHAPPFDTQQGSGIAGQDQLERDLLDAIEEQERLLQQEKSQQQWQ